MPISLTALALLCLAAFLAGVVDAIAGGGGLVTLPALLAAGLPPQLALGTNKGQSVFGSFASLVQFTRAGLVNRRRALATFPAGLAGSLLGAALLLELDPAVLRPLVLALLVIAGAAVALRRPGAERPTHPPPRRATLIAVAVALVLGGYDGFFGPGTGTFLILLFVSLLGSTLPAASADAKVVNFASNLAAVSLFAYRGVVIWAIALPMAAAQALGGIAGTHLAVKGGARVIRVAVLLVIAGLVVKLAIDLVRSG
ncbi:MAG: TSUP family transporter [Myxococcaceae bacterium]